MTIYTLPHGGWARWRRNLRLLLAWCKALRTNWALWYPVRYKMWTNERCCCCCYLISYNSLADVVRLLAEWSDTKSDVKLGGFRSQLQASCVSSNTEELWYKEAICLWIRIYIYIYIYIYRHPQTGCFVVSQLFSLAWYEGWFKLGSKPT